MKKLNLLALGLLLSIFSFAQGKNGTVHLSEDFSSTFPPTGWTIENYGTKWTLSNSAIAGGSAPELKFTYTQGSLTTRFISPSVDLSGVENLVLSFRQFVDHYGTGYSVGVATRSNSGEWNTVWSVSPEDNIGPELHDIIISNDDVGSSNFQFCFFLSGNAYQIDYWFIDDVELFTPFSNDITVSSIVAPDYFAQGDMTIGAVVRNVGLSNVTSFDVNYQIDGGEVVTQSFSGLNLEQTDTYEIEFDQTWAATPGTFTLTVFVSNYNGAGDDNDTENDSQSKTLNIASQTTVNMPLFESFTSSTCGPCASFNGSVFNSFLSSNIERLSIIKYQMSWPQPGDPYYNEDGGTRRVYYGVISVPSLFAGGNSVETSENEINAQLNDLEDEEAFFEISVKATYLGTTVTAKIDVSPYISASGLKLHAAVVEKETTENVGSNGETSFKYVMMKMLPDGNGTTVDFIDGQDYSITLTQDLTSTFVEQYDDLELVVFIQNDDNKQVYQSKMVDITEGSTGIPSSTLKGFSIYPNPTNGTFSLEMPEETGMSFVEIYSITGALVYSSNISETKSQRFDLGLQKGAYIVSITTLDGTKLSQKLIVK
ncbi:MAG TPA: T9SS type A sorting domain-containing protein [Tenuifilaceae bacterium]|nr:T9SS type A sorting domain-containing protein [Tenuifilaceae bacterium]HPJ45436.1 T9SS type A sorting domain-containing protein [Tenuifilaceae bacterium]HPQ34053.1 T9SS type A sorting domain-containing protein [Tenuifilaceae bacterium]